MDIDIRLPIGGMFTIFGLLLTIFGLLSNSDQEIYHRSFGININLWSGLVMLVFGLLMLGVAIRSMKKKKL